MDVNKLIKYVFLFFITMILVKCSDKKVKSEQIMTDNVFTDVELPRIDGLKKIFILKNGIIYQLFLNSIYETYFKPNGEEYNQDVFLNKYIYNHKLSSEDLEKISYFYSKVNEQFLNKYEHTNVDVLKEKFCIDTGYKTYIKNELDYNTQVTLCYIFFKNNYNIGFDDVEGIFVINNV